MFNRLFSGFAWDRIRYLYLKPFTHVVSCLFGWKPIIESLKGAALV